MIRYGSVCSGIEAATTAWHPLGWKPVFFSEIEPFPCSVLAHHWPDVPNLGDMTKHKDWNHALEIDLLVGGTPCQAFSIAGLRAGLADPRGNLTLTFLGLVDQFKPRWVVWENVPGVLSEKTGAFGLFLEGLAQLGYGWAYRILDAQYFGVAQRRRRVFVVACAGADWRRAAAVLFEPDCLRGNPPPSRQAGQESTAATIRSTDGGSDVDHARGGHLQPVVGTLNASGSATQQNAESGLLVAFGGNNRTGPIDAAAALNAKGGSGRMDFESETFIATTLRARDGSKGVDSDCTDTLVPVPGYIHPRQCRNSQTSNQLGIKPDAQVADALTSEGPGAVLQTMRVRRLTPRECERLQGFPDDHTFVPHRGKPAADGPRYKAIGNSMAVPVMAWIGRRIQNLEKDAS